MHDPQSAPPDAPQWRTDGQVPVQPPAPPVVAESPTEPFTPTFAAPPAAPPAAPDPAAWGRPMFAPPEPAAPAPKASTARRSSGVGLVVAAVLATAVLTSGGTYLAMSAAGIGGTAAHPAAGLHADGRGLRNAAHAGAHRRGAGNAGARRSGHAGPRRARRGQASVVDIVKAVSPAVVTIVGRGCHRDRSHHRHVRRGTATGSGVIFDANGLILTNRHVVSGSPSKLTVNLKDGRSFDATVYGVDTLTDLAIVKVDETGLPTAPIGDSSTDPGGPAGDRHRQPAGRVHGLGHERDHLRPRAQHPGRGRAPLQPHPDRHGHQPRQQRRPAPRPDR